MKKFREMRSETTQPEDATENLEESFLRSGAVLSYASKSKASGKKAEQAFARGSQSLNGNLPNQTIEVRLAHLENATAEMLDGLKHLRHQIGAGIAANVSAHLLSAKKQSTRRRR